MRQHVYQVCYTRYNVSFYLRLIGSVLKRCKVPKYYDHDCSITKLPTTTALNAEINEVKNKIPNVPNLTITTALIAVENKLLNISKIEKKY